MDGHKLFGKGRQGLDQNVCQGGDEQGSKGMAVAWLERGEIQSGRGTARELHGEGTRSTEPAGSCSGTR